MLGPDQPVVLHLLEITPALDALRGVVMELEDCAFPLLAGVVQTDDANKAFEGVNIAMLVELKTKNDAATDKKFDDLLPQGAAVHMTAPLAGRG